MPVSLFFVSDWHLHWELAIVVNWEFLLRFDKVLKRISIVSVFSVEVLVVEEFVQVNCSDLFFARRITIRNFELFKSYRFILDIRKLLLRRVASLCLRRKPIKVRMIYRSASYGLKAVDRLVLRRSMAVARELAFC